MEDALSAVVLPAKIFTDQVEDKFCPITHPLRVNCKQQSTNQIGEGNATRICVLREEKECTKPNHY